MVIPARVALCVVCAMCIFHGCFTLPLSADSDPQTRMVTLMPPGSEAGNPTTDKMDEELDCNGDSGAELKYVDVWPSPSSAPSLSRAAHQEIISQEPSAPPAPCQDDPSFIDSNGMSCEAYEMNKQLCSVSDRFANKRGQTAKHACCTCGGSVKVAPTVEQKCVRSPMGGSEGCAEERYATLETNNLPTVSDGTNMDGSDDEPVTQPPRDSLPPTKQDPSGLGDIAVEDELEDRDVDDFGTIESMDQILGNDTEIFREHNFDGTPNEPPPTQKPLRTQYVTAGTIKFSLKFSATWLAEHGGAVIQGLSHVAEVDHSQVMLTSVRPGSIIVSFRITSANTTIEVARGVEDKLNVGFHDGSFMFFLRQHGFPRCNFTVVSNSTTNSETVPDIDVESGSQYKHYTTFAYVVQEGDTIASIATKFQVEASLLVAFNEEIDPSLLSAGEIVYIPVPKPFQVTNVSPLTSPLKGGVKVLVEGNGFESPAFCKFGDVITQAIFVVDDAIACISPEQSRAGLYAISVSDGKGGFLEVPFTFNYTEGIIPFCDEDGATLPRCRVRTAIHKITPTKVPQDTETVIQVFGAGFNLSSVCLVNGKPVKTKVISRSKLNCTLPAQDPSTVSLSVSQESYKSSALKIEVYSTLALYSIEPLKGPKAGGTVVYLNGTSFKPGARCRFNSTVVTAKYISSKMLECVTPGGLTKSVIVDVTNDGHIYSPASVQFEYTFLKLNNLSATEGRAAGGYPIILTGYGFYPGMYCRFGSIKVSAVYISLTTASCRVPPQGQDKSVPVSVSLNGVTEWTEDEIRFEYYTAINEIRPSKGRASGGDEVSVFGSNFDQFCEYTCRFDRTIVPAVVVTSSQLHCISPPGNGTVDFALETRDKIYRLSAVGEKMTFTYLPAQDLDVFAIFPSHTDVRVTNLSVIVSGAGFTPESRCRFGDVLADMTFVDAKTIKCAAPRRDLAELVTVSISRNAGRSWSQPIAEFEYRAVIEYLEPPIGAVEGGNLLTVHGQGFNPLMSICVFGNKAVPAVVESSTVATCVVPRSEAPTKVPFAVSTNVSAMRDPYLEFQFKYPQADVWGTWYLYSAKPTLNVNSIEPAYGSTIGGNTVTVTGEGFDRTTHCMFGETSVQAVFMDATTVKCVVPTHPEGKVDFSVVLFNRTEGFNTSIRRVSYSYHSPSVSRLDPSTGFVTGGDNVRIFGQFLRGAIMCSFGNQKTPIVEATDTYVQCKSPSIDVARTVPVTLGFGSNGCGGGDLQFTYHPIVTSLNPSNGFIMSSKQIVTIEGKGFGGEPLQCAFNDLDFVPATVVSSTEIECHVPLSPVAHLAHVRLTNVQRVVSVGDQSFGYKYNPVIEDYYPNVGSTTGNTIVVFVGSGLSMATHCSFDGERVSAIVVSDTMVRCRTPDHLPGIVSVSVVGDTGVEATSFVSSSVEFTFKIMNTHVESLQPSSGSTDGGLMVSIRGSGFSMGSFCRFGDIEVPVIFYASDFVACYTPAVAGDRTVTVEVSQTGGSEGYSSDGHTFSFVSDSPSVSRIEPAWGEEGTDILVVGSKFTPNDTCFFGTRPAKKATYLSSTQIRCIVPKLGLRYDEILQVSSSADYLPGGYILFHYERSLGDTKTIAVREIVPNTGSSDGGTVVTVYGVNFPKDPMCKFGDLFVRASPISDKIVKCETPKHRPATTALEITTKDRTRFSSSYIRYTFTPSADLTDDLEYGVVPGSALGEPSLDTITPITGSPPGSITLVGQSFSPVGYCKFSDSKFIRISKATVVDSSHVTCKIPDLLTGMSKKVLVTYLSVGGASSQPLPFSYL